MKMVVFWDVTPCSLEVNRRFRGAYCDALIMETVITSETSVSFYKTTRLNIQKKAMFIIIAVRT
jgi:hypothetical protein